MCSLTWLATAGGYELLFNRDELHTRAPSLPPRAVERGGVRWLAPVDPEGGGTWIAANDRGLTVAVLNGALQPRPAAPASRGLLVDALAGEVALADVARTLGRADLQRFAPFTLVVVEVGSARSATWDGRDLAWRALAEVDLPLSSSSSDPEGARANRRGVWAALRSGQPVLDLELLERYHRSHEPEPSARSVCMHRADAQTVSFTRVRVTPVRVEMGHAGAAPCRAGALDWLELPRAMAGMGARGD